MATFYETHQKAIDRAFNVYRLRPGECFRVIMWEPLSPITDPTQIANDTVTIITFRLLPDCHIEPADLADRKAIAEFNERHRNTPKEAWDLPDVGAPPAPIGAP